MVDLLRKGRLNEIPRLIRNIKAQIDAIDDIEVIVDPPLPRLDLRVLRIFARRQRGISLLVEDLSGGLSEIRVRRVTVRDEHGNQRLTVAARLGTISEIAQEIAKYTREIIRLPAGRYAVSAGDLFAGAGACAGVFYGLISGSESLGALLRNDPARAALVVGRLENAERIWTESYSQRAVTVQDIRRVFVTDAEIQDVSRYLTGIDWQTFEQRRIQVNLCCQHSDLHCENVQVESQTGPAMIDYAEVQEAPAALDPLTLEISPLFHPRSPIKDGRWPSPDQAEHWDNLELYVEGCPIESFIRACRAWAIRVAAGRRELYATAYSITVKQLKYADTPKNLAVAIAKAAISTSDRT